MSNEKTKRIAYNTIFLYVRMLFLLLISLYTVRVTLNILGVENYGIYNIVGNVVVLFSFINAASSASTQRYLNFALGKNDLIKASQILTSSIKIHVIVAILILVLSETVGLWILKHYLVIPENRIGAAYWAYQISVFTTMLNVIRIPYNATIIAYERMSFYALLSVLEGILKLLIVFLLSFFKIDKLVLYTILLFFLSLCILLVFLIYVRFNFSISKWQRKIEKGLYKELLSFSGWNLISSIGDVVSTQGLNFIVNRFFGVVANAAIGIANQVNNAVYGLISNFQVAFEPQIVKSYAADDKEYLMNLIFKTSKFSYYLLYFFVLPLSINANLVLQVWLKDIPDYSVVFLRLTLFYSLLNALIGPLWMVAYAIGNIRNYQVIACCNAMIQLPLLWLCFVFGTPVYTIMLIRIFSNLTFSIWRLYYLYKRMKFPVVSYIKKVIIPIVFVTLISLAITYLSFRYTNGVFQFFFSCSISVICNLLLFYFIGSTSGEKQALKQYLLKILKKVKG